MIIISDSEFETELLLMMLGEMLIREGRRHTAFTILNILLCGVSTLWIIILFWIVLIKNILELLLILY